MAETAQYFLFGGEWYEAAGGMHDYIEASFTKTAAIARAQTLFDSKRYDWIQVAGVVNADLQIIHTVNNLKTATEEAVGLLTDAEQVPCANAKGCGGLIEYTQVPHKYVCATASLCTAYLASNERVPQKTNDEH